MPRLLDIWRRLIRLPQRRARERELAEEMRDHIERRAQELEADGLPPQEARRQALVAFGNPVALGEQSDDAWSFPRVETWLRDVRYGGRLLWRDRGWAVMAAATLALGISGTVTIFTFVNAFLLRPLPFDDPDQLVHVWATDAKLGIGQGRISGPDFLDLRREATLFTDLAAFNYTEEDLHTGGEPERVAAGRVTANAFTLLGVAPIAGRDFAPGADRPGGPREVLLSEALWSARFNRDPRVLGRSINLNGVPYTVVGVMPDRFVFPLPITRIWAPRVIDPAEEGRANRYVQVFGRLEPQATASQAAAELEAIAARLGARHPDVNANLSFRHEPLRDALNFASELLPFMSAALGASALFVFLIACANVASLMLTRGVSRTHELAVRAALGAGRRRLVRQLLTESVLLAGAGAAAGVLLASWSLARLTAAVPPDLYRVGDLALDRDALAFAALAALTSVAVFGILPALRATRPDPNAVLKEGVRTTAGGRRRLHGALVTAQIAICTVLLVAALLMLASVRELRQVPLGFAPDGVLTAKLILRGERYADPPRAAAFHAALVDRAEETPGLRAATVNFLPLNHETNIREVFAPGSPVVSGDGVQANTVAVSPGYFEVMRIPLLRGRAFSDADTQAAPRVAIVSEPLADALFAGRDPLGASIVMGSRTGDNTSYRIVGVAAATRHREIRGAPDRHFYVPQLQEPTRYLRLAVRGAPGAAPSAAVVRDAVRALDPALPVTEVRTLSEVVDEFLLPETQVGGALTEQSIVALLLALVGLYGVASFTVSLRRREIGVRMALGASRFEVMRLIVGHGLRLGAAGVAIGAAGAFALTRFLRDLLFGVSAADPAVFAGVAVLLLACSMLACHVPARRASRVDPVQVLRADG